MNNDILKYFKGDSTALPELKKALAQWGDKDTHFEFRGRLLDRKYAHYLVEYLEMHIKAS